MKLRASLAFLFIGCSSPVTAPSVQPPVPHTSSHQAPGVASVTDEHGAVFQISQGVPGDPAVVGCADGQREAFVDSAAFPSVAGCIAEWTGTLSMRTPATNRACGDDLGTCAAPGDACAQGWHLCGASGSIAEVAAIGIDACERAGGGRFVSAISHCETQSGCEYDRTPTGDYQCFPNGWCSEPVCCGSDCGEMGACPSGVWEGRTHIPVGVDQGCGAIGSSRARGVLCCR
jgi:hypothetical protein